MKLKTKKIVAKEFLLLMGCLSFSAVFFLGTILFNYVIELKIRKTEKLIIPMNEKINSLKVLNDEKLAKQKWFFENGIEKIAPGEYKFSVVWERMEYLQKNDSIIYNWENIWIDNFKNNLENIGFNDAQEFNQFIKENSIPIEDYVRIDSIHTEKLKLNDKISNFSGKTLNLEDQFRFSLIILIIVVIFTYPVRYLYFLIKWSFKTLKQKE